MLYTILMFVMYHQNIISFAFRARETVNNNEPAKEVLRW